VLAISQSGRIDIIALDGTFTKTIVTGPAQPPFVPGQPYANIGAYSPGAALAFSPDGTTLAAAIIPEQGAIAISRNATGGCVVDSYIPDVRLALYDVRTSTQLASVQPGYRAASDVGLRFQPGANGLQLIVIPKDAYCSPEASVWDPKTLRRIATIAAPGGAEQVEDVNRNVFVTSDGGFARVRFRGTGQLLGQPIPASISFSGEMLGGAHVALADASASSIIISAANGDIRLHSLAPQPGGARENTGLVLPADFDPAINGAIAPDLQKLHFGTINASTFSTYRAVGSFPRPRSLSGCRTPHSSYGILITLPHSSARPSYWGPT
jgi:hypothetical protein